MRVPARDPRRGRAAAKGLAQPGAADRQRPYAGQSPDEFAKTFVKTLRPTSLLERFASVEEVADMVVYAASKEASATNGAALRVDGGVVRSIA